VHQEAGLLVDLHDVLVLALGLLRLVLSLFALDCYALLLRLEQVHGNGVGVGHLDELEALGVQSGDAPLRPRQPLRMVGVLEDLFAQLPGDDLAVHLLEPDPAVPAALNAILYFEDWQIGQVATGRLVAGAADKVVEDPAVSALAGGVEQAVAAAGACQQATQVVAVLALLDRVTFALLQYPLNPVEQPGPDERRVFARMLDATVCD
jgi:hypothetical protein